MISIHAPPRGATKNHMAGLAERADFNSRPSARGDDFRRARCGVLAHFNSRPSARGDRRASRDGCGTEHFNSRPSARGDWFMAFAGAIGISFQFTPLREGRPPTFTPEAGKLRISIHAPPRGATYDGERVRFAAWRYFNSRPSARGDPPNDQGVGSANYFNSRPSARGDGRFADGLLLCTKFQFTPLREGRQCSISRRFPDFLFQFTPLREGRHLVRESLYAPCSFQFTPLREGRRRCSTI